jgi:hypothetical protein
VLPALLAVPVFLAKNDHAIEVFPQWIYQSFAIVFEGLLLVLILEFVYGAYRRCFGSGSCPEDGLQTLAAHGESSALKDFVSQVGRRNLVLEAIVLGSLIYLFFPRSVEPFTAMFEWVTGKLEGVFVSGTARP